MEQICSACTKSKAPSQFKKFTTCKTKPCNTVCNHCWTQYLKSDFMNTPAKELACFDCKMPLDKDKNLELLLRSPADREYYEYCLKRTLARKNGEVVCVFADCHNVSVQFEEGSRISTCGSCTRQACIPCGGIPEHLGETCEQYQARIVREHAQENIATADALANGYSGREEVGAHGIVRSRPKKPLPCPTCGVWIERIGGCLRLRCPVCSLDFCGSCAVPYLGKNSVPVNGNKGHHETCSYFKRKIEDYRFESRASMKKQSGSDSEGGADGSMKKRSGADSGSGADGSMKKQRSGSPSGTEGSTETQRPGSAIGAD